ncbi:hypothetical protein [Kitasatospora terrestris]|uniref:Uncharacterized protein n=1 Tax=Kitasatospora terrestris TaxID=258051 RepID=A0ABP9EU66_9ACTN
MTFLVAYGLPLPDQADHVRRVAFTTATAALGLPVRTIDLTITDVLPPPDPRRPSGTGREHEHHPSAVRTSPHGHHP